MRIYDSLTETTVQLPETWKSQLRLFVCGPTVYDKSHIGHARTYIAFDTIVRWLRHREYRVFYLQNITDIDNKIIDRAREERSSWKDVARHNEKLYLHDMDTLNIQTVTRYARASDYIPQIIEQINTLIEKQHAYETDDGVYFSVTSFPHYGDLSKQDIDAMRSGARVEINEQKQNPLDFALWKKTDVEPVWHSPWGPGRPGWHIEDTAITQHFFGPQYEMHGGASELKFPHHEAEIAQQESASGKSPLVSNWLHTGVLLVDGKKMSKSLKNFVTIEEFLKTYSPNVLRLLVLSHLYRSPIDYSPALADAFARSWQTIVTFITKLWFVADKDKNNTDKDIDPTEYGKRFDSAMDTDINTPEALATLFSLIHDIEPSIYSLSSNDAKTIANHIIERLNLLGFVNIPRQYKTSFRIRSLLKKREEARTNQQFTPADTLRNKVEALGYMIEDTPLGPFAITHHDKTS